PSSSSRIRSTGTGVPPTESRNRSTAVQYFHTRGVDGRFCLKSPFRSPSTTGEELPLCAATKPALKLSKLCSSSLRL
nr:hypothetical protein [Tanacetum cinerariifolium]